jgi:DNA-binding response OmpR family regulator
MDTTIVIVEDEEDILELIEYNLQKHGFETIGFISTKNVFQALKEESVDLLIMDRNLPGIDGSEFVSHIRSKDIHIPVIYLSAKNKDSDIEEGFESGGDDYITKPFSLTAKEIKLLELFLKNKNKILNKEEIFETLYDYNEEANEASLRVFINKIRNIIGKEKIKTIKNMGYLYVG